MKCCGIVCGIMTRFRSCTYLSINVMKPSIPPPCEMRVLPAPGWPSGTLATNQPKA